MLTDAELIKLYQLTKNIAIVGLSDNPDRPSYLVASYLKQHGYKIFPVNPKYETILSEKCFPSLVDVSLALAPEKIEIVDIFRRSDDVAPHVDEAIKVGAKIVWMQEGIEHNDAAKKAETAGLVVVMNRCLMKEHKRLITLISN